MAYAFYGWNHGDVPAITNEYGETWTPCKLYDALSNIWCEYTCAPRLREKWSKENRTLGQCSITARYIWRQSIRNSSARRKLSLL